MVQALLGSTTSASRSQHPVWKDTTFTGTQNGQKLFVENLFHTFVAKL